MDFPDLLAHRYAIHNVKVQQFHFLSMEPSYFEKFHGWLQQAKSWMVNIDFELDTT